jgi:uncharacterized membrane protein
MNIAKTLRNLGIGLVVVGVLLLVFGVVKPVLDPGVVETPGVTLDELFPWLVTHSFSILFDAEFDPIERLVAAGVLLIGLGIALLLIGIVTGIFASKKPEALTPAPAAPDVPPAD